MQTQASIAELEAYRLIAKVLGRVTEPPKEP